MNRRVLQCAAVLAVVAGSVLMATDAKACFGGCCRQRSCCYQPVCYQAYYQPSCGCGSYGYGGGGGCGCASAYYAPAYPVVYQPAYQPVYAVQPAYYAPAPVAVYGAPYHYSYTSRIRVRY